MWGIPVYSDVDMTVTVVTGAASGMGRLCVESLRGTTDHLVTVDLVAPQIEGTVGIVCDVSDPHAVAELVGRVQALGSFRGLAHAAGVSPTMTHARRVLEIDLVGTALLLKAFEPLVEPGSAAVCFSSSSAYQVALQGIDTELQSLVSEPLVPGFLDAAERDSPTAALPTRGRNVGSSRWPPGRQSRGAARRAGELIGARTDRHANGSPRGRAAANHESDAGEDAS